MDDRSTLLLVNTNTQQHPVIHSEGLRPVQPNEFLPPVGRWATCGSITMLAIFGGTIALVAMLKYPTTVKASAIIRPTGELRVVQAATTGKVNRIDEKLHQVVERGQAIASLHKTSVD